MGRTRPAVAEASEIVEALFRARRHVLALGHVLGQFGYGRRQIKKHPVDPRAGRRVGVVHDQHEGFGARRGAAPLQRG